MVEIVRLAEAKESYIADINKLLPQLRSNPAEHAGVLADLKEVVSDPSIFLVVAKDGDEIVGMGFLYTIIKIGKRSGSVEDVVVDNDYRGQGFGEKITQALIDIARHEGLKSLYLTSSPERVTAYRLYEKLGFKKRDTFVFKLNLQ